MTFSAVRFAPLRNSRSLRIPRQAATFHNTPLRAALNESSRAHHQDTPEVAEKIEQKKNEQLHEQKQGKGEWKADLASDSEQAVRHDDHDMSMEEMQKHGAKAAEEGKEHPNKAKEASGV